MAAELRQGDKELRFSNTQGISITFFVHLKMTACVKTLLSFYVFLKVGEWNIVRKRNEQASK